MLKQREKKEKTTKRGPVDKLWKNQGFSVDNPVDKLWVSCVHLRALELSTKELTSYPLGYPQGYPQDFGPKPLGNTRFCFFSLSKRPAPTTDYLFIT